MNIRYSFILAACFATSSASAQFNTVSRYRLLYNVSVVDNKKAGKEACEQKMVPSLVETDTIGKRKEWIDRYTSVSYPLRNIEVTSGYGNRTDPFTGKKSCHKGIDLRAVHGEEAYAMMFGKVCKVGSDKRSGNYVTIRHGDFMVSYCHLSKTLVRKGEIVYAGTPVGLTGSTGRSTGPHLHITLKRGRKKINPGIMLDYVGIIREESLSNPVLLQD